MNPSAPQGVDMALIREAMQRRSQSGVGTPATQQMTTPQQPLPTGGTNTPTQQAPMAPQPTQNVAPQGSPVSPEGAVIGKLKQGASFDDETKSVAKQLVAKLIGVL